MDHIEIDAAVAAQARTPRLAFMSVKELLELPPPEWLIDGVMEEEAFAVLYGAPGEGKTFVALDWALCLATNRKWHGRAVTHGAVVYVIGEGGRNIGRRIGAWMQEHGISDVAQMFAVLQAVQLTDDVHLSALETEIKRRELKPRLIVFDTLARCFGGGDENSAKDMGAFVAGCDRLRIATGAAVLAVHHTGKGGNATTERGSSALRGAADSMIHVHKKGKETICVAIDKQKDDELMNELYFRFRPVTLNRTGSAGSRSTSAVLDPLDAAEDPALPFLDEGPLKTLRALTAHTEDAAYSGTWRKAVPSIDGKPIPQRTFQNHRDLLLQRGLVEKLYERRQWYRATLLGVASANGVPLPPTAQRPDGAASATPPLGVASGTGEALDVIGQIVTLSEEDETGTSTG